MSTVEKTGVDDSYSKSYEPVAHLNEVQLESGEENEELLYKCRAKLLRMDRSLAQPEWRERGVGEVKFLRTKGTEKVRILMRREITLNLCLNHFIAEGLDLTPNPGSDRGWMWRANDFDGEKTSMEIFFIRFNTVEQATEFKTLFERIVRKEDIAGIPVVDEPAPKVDDKTDDKKEEGKSEETKPETEKEGTKEEKKE